MRAAKVDKNQREIVMALRQVPGCSVAVTSSAHDGFPDLVVGFRGTNSMLEVKDRNGKLTPAQEKFHASWRGQIEVIRSVEEALRAIGAIK